MDVSSIFLPSLSSPDSLSTSKSILIQGLWSVNKIKLKTAPPNVLLCFPCQAGSCQQRTSSLERPPATWQMAGGVRATGDRGVCSHPGGSATDFLEKSPPIWVLTHSQRGRWAGWLVRCCQQRHSKMTDFLLCHRAACLLIPRLAHLPPSTLTGHAGPRPQRCWA